MTVAATLTRYIAARFAMSVLAMLAGLTLLVSLFDFIELLRRAATRPDAGFLLVAEIAGLRLPFVMLQLLPFAVLIGGITAFWRLTRSSELIVARAAGISAWGFLVGPVIVALLAGGVGTLAVSPLSSAMLARAERLDYAYLRASAGLTALAGGRLWLRQADRGLDRAGVAILTGRPAARAGADRAGGPGTLLLEEVSIWRLAEDDRPLARIEAPQARLLPGRWTIEHAIVFEGDRGQAAAPQTLALPTDLTADRIETSFASPDTLSIFALPGFIAVLEQAGFSAVRHRLHFQALLALPLLTAAMALLAASFSMRSTRSGGAARMIGFGVAAGFLLFVLDKITGEFGEAGTLPVALAAWAPTIAGLLIALSLLLHLEDG
jgi:lipopolysaccharide export system permease protein